MKKLLFVAMAVALASAASAASHSWTFGSPTVSGDNAKLYAGYTGVGKSSEILGSGYYVYYISVHQNDYAWDSVAGQNKLNDVAGKVLTALRTGHSVGYGADDAGESVLVTSETTANGLVVDKSGVEVDSSLYAFPSKDTSNKYLEVLTAVVGDGYVYFAMNRGDAAAENKRYDLPSNRSTQLKDSTGEGAYAGYGWYAIPEPTSGLLLLLGMAGLALRRRRA